MKRRKKAKGERKERGEKRNKKVVKGDLKKRLRVLGGATCSAYRPLREWSIVRGDTRSLLMVKPPPPPFGLHRKTLHINLRLIEKKD